MEDAELIKMITVGQHMYVDVRGRSETNLNILSMPIFPKPVGVHNETDSSRYSA